MLKKFLERKEVINNAIITKVEEKKEEKKGYDVDFLENI